MAAYQEASAAVIRSYAMTAAASERKGPPCHVPREELRASSDLYAM